MRENQNPQERYDRIAEQVYDQYGQVELLAAKHLNLAEAFSQAMAEAADGVDEGYAAEFRQRLVTEQVEGGWPNPDLLAEVLERNPAARENFLDRFEAISEQQCQAYTAELDELIASMHTSQSQPEQPTKPRLSRARSLARATMRGLSTLRL